MVEERYYTLSLSGRIGILFIGVGFVVCFTSFYYFPSMVIYPDAGNYVNLGFTMGFGLISKP